MIDELKAIAIFAKTVEAGSFRAAAKQLDLAPSVVSYHVSKLEHTYGVALLYRSTRKLSLTDKGKKLFAHAKQMVKEAESGFDILANESTTPAGSLHITLPAVLARDPLINQIAAFAIDHPKVDLRINFSDIQQDIISSGIDLAIRVGTLKDSALKAKRISQIERKLVAHPGFCKKKINKPRDIEGLEWITMEMMPPTKIFRDKRGNRIEIACESRIKVDSADAMCQLAIAGLGLATPPTFLVETEIAAGKLVELLPALQVQPLEVYAVWPANAPRESLTNRLIGYLNQG
ncbi:LysR family transcriptional regulator [Sedimenticola sp.]|uniref:LysR family transcriptional regulator n=1 Tax=Sedimenticola sp. TaxID=1940285 RepID=UPI003D0EEF98